MPRILVIDDEAPVRTLFQMTLERAGYEVAVASDGKEGMESHRECPADVIITDIVMPEKEGLETIVELRRDFPEVKIIAISGGGRIGPDSYLDMAKSLGAHCAFAKPVNRDELLAALRELIGGP